MSTDKEQKLNLYIRDKKLFCVILKAVKMGHVTLFFALISFVASYKSYHEHTVRKINL